MGNQYINNFGNKIIFKNIEFKERLKKIKDEMNKKKIDILLIEALQINFMQQVMTDGHFIHHR